MRKIALPRCRQGRSLVQAVFVGAKGLDDALDLDRVHRLGGCEEDLAGFALIVGPAKSNVASRLTTAQWLRGPSHYRAGCPAASEPGQQRDLAADAAIG